MSSASEARPGDLWANKLNNRMEEERRVKN